MAVKRMFSTAFVASDEFNELSPAQQCLYFRILGSADDYGFTTAVNSCRKTLELPESDLQALYDHGFLIRFDSCTVVRHWFVHNYEINKDSKNMTQTRFQKEYQNLELENKVYQLREHSQEIPSDFPESPSDSQGIPGDSPESPSDSSEIHSADKTNEVNKCNKVNKNNEQQKKAAFDRFWTLYPRHEAKQNAQKAFDKINPDADLLNVICAAVERWKKTEQWTKDNGKYIPHPGTWLNQRRWEDDIPAPSPQGQVKRVQEQAYEQRQNDEHEMSDTPEWMKRYRAEFASGE